MLTVTNNASVLGASVTGVDLSKPLSDKDFAGILRALGERGVLRFPGQLLEPAALRDFPCALAASKPR